MRIRHVIVGLVLAFVLVAAFVAWAWRPSMDETEPPSPAAFDAALVAKGAALAAVGNCVTCHTAEGGPSYAGGRMLRTPFGTIHGTNITPDSQYGIGRWSEAAFVRAMREGVSREGRHLYPAFPYDHFARMPDEDLEALYAYLMTRDPAAASVPPNDLRFPFNIRMLISAWKALYLRPEPVPADAAQSAEWNRGAYLVHGPAHCGACHTPRNVLGAEKRDKALDGGETEGWHAPAINAASPAPLPWTVEALFEYLRSGRADRHPVAAGPMAEVVDNLAAAPEQDVRAIAAYIATFAGEDTAERRERAKQVLARAGNGTESDARSRNVAPATEAGGPPLQGGRATYSYACAGCHERGRAGPSSGTALHLALSTAVYLPTSHNLVRIILDGISPPEGERGPFMPGFAGALTDEQVVGLARFLRSELAKAPPWRDLEQEVKTVQRERERKLALSEMN